jgi:hypothetical protein
MRMMGFELLGQPDRDAETCCSLLRLWTVVITAKLRTRAKKNTVSKQHTFNVKRVTF